MSSVRTSLDQTSSQPTELVEPVNLQLNIRRNLAASWYKEMVAVEISGDLKPMKVGEGGSSAHLGRRRGGSGPMVVLEDGGDPSIFLMIVVFLVCFLLLVLWFYFLSVRIWKKF